MYIGQKFKWKKDNNIYVIVCIIENDYYFSLDDLDHKQKLYHIGMPQTSISFILKTDDKVELDCFKREMLPLNRIDKFKRILK